MFTFKRYIIFKYDLAKNKKTLFQVFFFGSYLCCCAKISNLIVQDGLPYLSFSSEKKRRRYSPKY